MNHPCYFSKNLFAQAIYCPCTKYLWKGLIKLPKSHLIAGPILESKDMCVIFQKKGKKKGKIMLKKGKIFENLGKNVQNLKVLRKRAGDCM